MRNDYICEMKITVCKKHDIKTIVKITDITGCTNFYNSKFLKKIKTYNYREYF